jgi:hypothetical protein
VRFPKGEKSQGLGIGKERQGMESRAAGRHRGQERLREGFGEKKMG